MGGGGFKNCPKLRVVIYRRPLTSVKLTHLFTIKSIKLKMPKCWTFYFPPTFFLILLLRQLLFVVPIFFRARCFMTTLIQFLPFGSFHFFHIFAKKKKNHKMQKKMFFGPDLQIIFFSLSVINGMELFKLSIREMFFVVRSEA